MQQNLTNNKHLLVLSTRPDSINDVVQYGRKRADLVSLKKKWQQITEGQLLYDLATNNIPEHFDCKVGFFFKFYFELNRRRDADNYFLMCKGIIDAIVNTGIIDDDDYRYVDFDGIRIYTDRERPRLEVHITEKKYASRKNPITRYQRYKIELGNRGLEGLAKEVIVLYDTAKSLSSINEKDNEGTKDKCSTVLQDKKQ
jgi:Holliday junction resolvase RusA-like endonuclease